MTALERSSRQCFWLTVAVLLLIPTIAIIGHLRAQDTTAPVKFVLSESESLRLENLRLRRQILLLRLNQLQAEMRQHSSDAAAFARETLGAHGSPAGVSFNEQTLDFVIAPPKTEPQNLRKEGSEKKKP